MKYILMIIWFICTTLLCCSIVGLFLMLPPADRSRSTWLEIGSKLIDCITKR